MLTKCRCLIRKGILKSKKKQPLNVINVRILKSDRESLQEVFWMFFRNFAKFTGKHLCQSLFFNKVAVRKVAVRKVAVRRCSVRKGVLRNFAKFTGKDLCQSLFFNKVPGLSLQRRPWHRCSKNYKNF